MELVEADVQWRGPELAACLKEARWIDARGLESLLTIQARQVLSIAIYDHVESLEYTNAHWLSGGLLLLTFLMLLAVYAVNRRFSVARP